MSQKTDNFINVIGTIAKNEYLARDRWILPSVCIAQAVLESGWNLDAKSVFGIKGDGFVSSTSEYYNGHYVQIQDSFRAYPGVAASVVGYYDFLRDTPRYANALNNPSYKDAVDKLIHTIDGLSYATDPNYIDKIISIIDGYNLTEWDSREESTQMADNAPQEETAPQEADTGTQSYTVQGGDTLSGIASRFGTDYQTLASINNIPDANKIYPGQVINLTGDVQPQPEQQIEIGSTVRVTNAEQYSGGSFKVWFDTYTVMDINGDRAVIGVDGQVTAAINAVNLELV